MTSGRLELRYGVNPHQAAGGPLPSRAVKTIQAAVRLFHH